MLNNNQPTDQQDLSTLSRDQLINLMDQQNQEQSALFDNSLKAYKASILYWVMQDILALRAITDPIHYIDQVQVLSRRYASWGEKCDVQPF